MRVTCLFLALGLLSSNATAYLQEDQCAPNCGTCWGTLSTNCMSCIGNYVLQDYQCAATTCDASSNSYIQEDTNDDICKRTIGAYDFPCEPATYNKNQNSLSVDSCSDCSSGKFCSSWGNADTVGNCLPGHYCGAGSSLGSPVTEYGSTTPNTGFTNYFNGASGDVCEKGNYCPEASKVMTKCDAGYYCPNEYMSAVDTNLICQAGYYCSLGASKPTPGGPFSGIGTDTTGDICPKGHYCAAQSSQETECSTGFFLPYYGGILIDECVPCQVGKYCPSSGLAAPAGDCDAGYFCDEQSASARPVKCERDKFCPTGTLSMQTCPPGQYTVGEGSATCLTCPDGSYCAGQGGATQCPAGYYCQNDKIIPCPVTTYSEALGATSDATCTPCEGGFACKAPSVKTACNGGFYCTGAGEVERPNNSAQKGGVCIPGEYCPPNVSSQETCTAGLYCANYAGESSTGQCRAGYYCPAGSEKPDQIICPAGHYCPIGSSVETPCPKGTYSLSTGAISLTDCDECPSGTFCNVEGLGTVPTDNCGAGYYCEEESRDDTGGAIDTDSDGDGSNDTGISECDKGYKCPAGVSAQILCEAGTYQPNTGQSECENCPAGSYCDGNDPTSSKTCPRGSYCPEGTKFYDQYPCAPGTYSSSTGLTDGSQCTLCNNGYYCQFKGQTQQSTKILARYHANGETGKIIPDPYLCPQAAYCPEGTEDALSCPDGKWTSSVGNSNDDDCIPCERGKWCTFETMRTAGYAAFDTFKAANGEYTLAQLIANVDISAYYGDCDDGYICLEGATRSNPASISDGGGYPCPVGHYCVSGEAVEMPCYPGTFNPNTQQASCQPCPAGEYCPDFGMTAGIECTEAYYCPGGDIAPIPCPVGTIAAPAGSDNQNDCLACPATFFCEQVGQLNEADKCAEGFICVGGDDRPGPYVTTYVASTTSGKCPIGSYCTSGASDKTACEAGFYNDAYQAQKCQRCPPGYYCVGGAIDKQECDAGYYCSVESRIKNPTDGQQGNICPVEHFCPSGSGQALKCRDGYRQLETTQATCDTCPKGYVCRGGETEPCSAYHYCDGDVAFPYGRLCPDGTYSEEPIEGFTGDYNCTYCPSAVFCAAGRIVGDCAPGYVCLERADSHTPDIDDYAYACPLGYYCPEGAEEPTRCPIGLFTFEKGAKQLSECTICQQGYYCNYDEVEPQDCPVGHYCPFNSLEPTECPRGTYNPYENKGMLKDCLPCAGGYYCDDTAIGVLASYGDTYKCPLGHYCPRGDDITPIKCIAGSYIDGTVKKSDGLSFIDAYSGTSLSYDSVKDCSLCPEHFYCEKGTNYRFAYPCPAGYYCPAGQGEPIKCPPGYYCTRSNKEIQKKLCPEGYYCPIGTEMPKKCGPETVCPKGSTLDSARGMLPEDCKPGEYLNVDMCLPCEPGFICELHTSQKYPLYLETEGGQECPPGKYCPGGITDGGVYDCPAGTYRLKTRGETADDCSPCPDGSANPYTGQSKCIVCGRGSSHNADKTSCQCNGSFNAWQESTNSCVCQPGYEEPIYTERQQSSTENLDCRPILAPVCSPGQFVNENNECVSKSSCQAEELCNGQASREIASGETVGYYDETLDGCFCRNIESNPTDYCDESCEDQSLKAYILPSGMIKLEAGGKSRVFDQEVFGDTIFFGGIVCNKPQCLITSQKMIDGKMVSSSEAAQEFIDVWVERVDPRYESPYATSFRMLASNFTRSLQSSGAKYMEASIQCIQPYDQVSFQVSNVNFPVYVKDSLYNTDPDYDAGVFTKLKNKLLYAELDIKSFVVSFTYPGVFVFGDYQDPLDAQTVVKVAEDESDCQGSIRWPLTSENLIKLGIAPEERAMKQLQGWLHAVPPFLIIVLFIGIWIQRRIEAAIEARELKRQLEREGVRDMAKYIKPQGKKFDKLEYLADLYKLIQDNLEKIKAHIAENDRRTEEEDRANMNKMLKQRHSLMGELKRGKGDIDLDDIKSSLYAMLENLRFADGRSLKDQLEAMRLQKKLEEHEARLREIENQEGNDSYEDLSEDEEPSKKSATESDGADSMLDYDSEKDEEEDLGQADYQDPALYDDMLKAREDMREKRKIFAANMDPSLSDEERRMLLDKYDAQQKQMEANLKREQEQQNDQLKARIAARQRKAKKQADDTVGQKVKSAEDKIKELEEKAEQLNNEIQDIENTGVNTKELKRAREQELKERMIEQDAERDAKLAKVRNDYQNRIKNAKSPGEKERLLQEMGRRLKSIEDQLNDERKRQEANLKNIIRQRQKKGVKAQTKELETEVNKIEDEIEALKDQVDREKAISYAENEASNLVDQKVAVRRDKIAEVIQNKFKNFNNTLTQQEQEDLEIQQAALQLEKEKELKVIEEQVDEELDNEKRDAEEEIDKLRRQIAGTDDPDERARLLAELAEREKAIDFLRNQEKRIQDQKLEDRRKRKAAMMEIKKMKLDLKALGKACDNEVKMNQQKFDEQVAQMEQFSDSHVDKEVRAVMGHSGPGKEQALILINETQDDLLSRKLKILMSKQFFDLSKYLATLQAEIGIEEQIKTTEIKQKFNQKKEQLINTGLQGKELEDALIKLGAERDLEIQLASEDLQSKQRQRESELREKKEHDFAEEKKLLITRAGTHKKNKIKAAMDKVPDDQTVQEVGKKMLARLDYTLKEELSYLDKQKEENLEQAKLRIITDNEEELKLLQSNLDKAVEKEEARLNEMMEQRKKEIMDLKKANLQDRLKMFAGEMSEQQIKELKKQYEQEYQNLETAIVEEKQKQLNAMRTAMLTRRIQKEKRIKAKQQAEQEEIRRQNVKKMNVGLAKAFREMIKKREAQGVGNTHRGSVTSSSIIGGKDQLRAKLIQWAKGVDSERNIRGGDEADIWKLEPAMTPEEKAAKLAEQEKATKEAENAGVEYTVNELFRRILKVEKLSEKVKDLGPMGFEGVFHGSDHNSSVGLLSGRGGGLQNRLVASRAKMGSRQQL